MNRKIYLSGKITGLNPKEARMLFAEAARNQSSQDEVINPYEIGLPDEWCWVADGVPDKERWERHMDRDLDLLHSCNCIFMLENWRDSTGARIELKEALQNGLDILGDITEAEIAKHLKN